MIAAPARAPPMVGDMRALVRDHDWTATPFGRRSAWSPALRASVDLILASPLGMIVLWGPDLVQIYNDAYRAVMGAKHPGGLGQPTRDCWPEIWAFNGPIYEAVLRGETRSFMGQALTIERYGRSEEAWFDLNYSALREAPLDGNSEGTVAGVLVTVVEVSERVRATAALRESELRVGQLFEQAPTFMAILAGPDHRFERINPGYSRLVDGRDVLGRTVAEALPEAVNQGFLALLDRVYQTGEAYSADSARFVLESGPGEPAHEMFVDLVYQPLHSGAGQVTGIFVEGADVTKRTLQDRALRASEAALREANATLERRVEERTAELRASEAQLQQAQKMEAIGQLTGGLAHDVNNMLQGIGGAVQLMERRVQGGRLADLPRLFRAAQEGVERAASLTHRLLAFARRGQLDARIVVMDELLTGMVDLIRRTAGPGIEVRTCLRDGAWTVRLDAAGLESALLNLAINARDAMPDGGTLTLATGEVTLFADDICAGEVAAPGDFVLLRVADTGAGMTPDVVARAFEPFFTTKPIGKGTGLGLSQLYGFVQQSGGLVRIESEVGQGTSFRLYLPRHLGDNAVDVATAAVAATAADGTGRTVLLVEDEAAVRALVREELGDRGYTVLEATDGPSGLAMLMGAARVDLLLTDVGLPGLNGRQMADAARVRRPALPVLFITGYAGGALDDTLPAGMAAIAKPFSLDVLVERIAAMLATAPGKA